MNENKIFNELILSLPVIKERHAPGSTLYNFLKLVSLQEVQSRFSSIESDEQDFGPFGNIIFPYRKMGAIDSMDLFGLDELIIFSYYWCNRNRYRRVVDIGANIGLHSLVLDRCGFEVKSFEPDPVHFELLTDNMNNNKCSNVYIKQAAISDSDGEAEFIRVLGNTTGSHLAGSKDSPYGDLEKFSVRIEAIKPLMEWADLFKIDAEGHEGTILSATEPQQWQTCDAMVEVGSERNAETIFHLLKEYQVNMFAQKLNWERVNHMEEMPTSYRDGSLFISKKDSMPW